jgi:hypothetical protein
LATVNEVNGGGSSLKTDWKTDGGVTIDGTTALKVVKEIGEVTCFQCS